MAAWRRVRLKVDSPRPLVYNLPVISAQRGNALGDRYQKSEYEAPPPYLLTPAQRRYTVLKRGLDLVLALLLLLVLALPMALIALALKLTRPREPVLFRQARVGQGDTLFTLYKFRSMESDGRRLAPLGRFLRTASLDELPQLALVLTGRMSLIGPRPLVPQEAEIRAMRRRLGVYQLRPGLSGLAQINGRDLVSDRDKAAYDRKYLENLSFRQDAAIFLATIGKVLRRADIEEK